MAVAMLRELLCPGRQRAVGEDINPEQTEREISVAQPAGDIARNVEGVVAVFNGITPAPIDYFSAEVILRELQKLWTGALRALPLALLGLLLFGFFFLLANPISRGLIKPLGLVSKSELVTVVVRRVFWLLLVLIGLYFFLRIAGLTQIAFAVISSTGLLGLIFGFAFRDIAENFMASLLLSVQRPFQLDDEIEIAGHTGIVRKVTARGTVLADFDGNHVQIPNATIYKGVIRNFSANPYTRGSFSIGIGYDAGIRQTQQLALNLLLNQEVVLRDPEPMVLVDNLGASTVNLRIYYWVDSRHYSIIKVNSMLMRLVVREFEQHGISRPDNARELIFPQGVPVQLDATPHTVTPRSQGLEQDSQFGLGAAEDIRSETDAIARQADKARDPEEGRNII